MLCTCIQFSPTYFSTIKCSALQLKIVDQMSTKVIDLKDFLRSLYYRVLQYCVRQFKMHKQQFIHAVRPFVYLILRFCMLAEHQGVGCARAFQHITVLKNVVLFPFLFTYEKTSVCEFHLQPHLPLNHYLSKLLLLSL